MFRPRSLTPSLLLAVLLSGAAAAAQTPCPCPTPPVGPPPLWSGNAQFSYAATSGNTDTSSLGGSLEVNYKPLPWVITLTAAYLRGSTDDELTAESFAGGLRGLRDLTPRLDVFAEALYYRNTFSGIDSRYGGNAGAGYKVLNAENLRLRFELGFGYTHEDHTLEIDPTLNYASMRPGFQFGWKFSKNAELTEEFYWTDNLSDTNDWFLRSTTALTASLTSVFALKASYTYLYDNVPAIESVGPPPDFVVTRFEKRDTITSVALVAKF